MCMHTLSNTRKSTQQEIKVLRVTKSAEKCKQSIDELLLDQDVCQSHYAGNQSPRKDRRGEQACPQGEADFYDIQPLSLD